MIVSDIHANRDALEAVLEDAAGKYQKIICCGDVVGYGADPNWAIEWARANSQMTVRGNHDKACCGLEDLDWFNPAARISALWTREELTPENLKWLRELPKGPAVVDGFDLVHGSPIDEDEYLLGIRDAADVAPYIEMEMSFFGHTHLQGGFLLHRNGVMRLRRPDASERAVTIELENDVAYLVNPGSVGQPRDGDPRAAYAIYAPEDRIVELHRTPYDVASAQNRIRGAGLPEVLADRLERGS